MDSTYYVKVYFTKNQQQQPEIRRFAIDISPNNNIYQELCTKIATYQPDIQVNGFILQYIDEENERITFSSTEELRSAIGSNQDSNTLKVFVTSNQQQQQQHQQDTADKECHTGVECDGCQGPVIGFRYKCVVCSNYDLCEKCSAAGVHSEHNMIKITKPGNFYHPYGPRHHGRRFRHIPPPPFVPNPEFIEQIQAQIPQWLPNRENTTHFRAHMQQHLDSLKTNTQTHMQNSKQYLESVGQYLQQALSPFGIDCDYRVDGQAAASTTPPTTGENTTQSEPSAVPKNPTETTTTDNNGISSWINMFRTGATIGTTATASATATATSQNETPQESEKEIEECVEKMKAMGFDNPNEDLMNIIRSKKGDLNSVLDEITRFHQE